MAKKVRDIKFMNRQMNKHYMKRGRQNNDLMRHFHDRNEGLQWMDDEIFLHIFSYLSG